MITRVLVDEGITAIGASTVALWKLENREAVLVAQIGSPRAVIEAVDRISIDETGALATAVRTRSAQFIESREAAVAHQSFVEARWALVEAVAFMPLVAGGRVLGALGLGFADPRAFDPSEREMLELFAGHAAQAIARARDGAAQRVLAEASSDLASSLDAAAVLERVGRLTVATFADWCFVDLLQPDGSLQRALVSHADPADAELAERLRALTTPTTTGVAAVIESQQPLLLEQLADHDYDRLAPDADRNDAARALRACSVLCVPMIVGGRAIGALTWLTRARALDARDEQFAGQVARAVAASLENARLYEAQLAAARRVGKLYELVVALSSARTPEDVASATARLATDAVGALSSMIWMRAADGSLRATGSSAPPDWTAEWMVLPAEGTLPAHRVMATGKPIFVETPDRLRTRREIGLCSCAGERAPERVRGAAAGRRRQDRRRARAGVRGRASLRPRRVHVPGRDRAQLRAGARALAALRERGRGARRGRVGRAARRTSSSRCSATSCATRSRRSSPRSS